MTTANRPLIVIVAGTGAMTYSETRVAGDEAHDMPAVAEEERTSSATPEPAEHRHGRVRSALPVVMMLAVVAFGAALPLIRNHIFYFWDDTAGAGLPNWLNMAKAVSGGDLPLLNLEMWRGGNFAGEGVGGVWNPVILLAAFGTYAIDNMAIAIAVAKTGFMLLMAGGCYLLARNYGVRPTLAATFGAMLPLSGYSLFVDSTAWLNGLILTALTPWLWWTARRALHNGGSFIWVVVAGYLCCSLGNPYGLLSTALVIGGVLVEAWFTGGRGRIPGLMLSGVAVLLLNVLIYLPLLNTTSVGYRAGSYTFNDEFLSPGLSDVGLMSTPSAQPYITTFGLPFMTVPGMYLAWFVLPLLPWLRWRAFAENWRMRVSALVFGGAFLLMMLGPSNIWMFRWPLRLVDFVWLATGLLFVILANAGLRGDHVRRRAVASGAIILAGGYLAWSDMPSQSYRHALSVVIVAALVFLLVRFGVTSMRGYATMAVGTLAVLALQAVAWFPGFYNVIDYQFPNSRAELTAQFSKYEGNLVQIADLGRIKPEDRLPDRAYRDMLFGNMYSVAGVESTTAYSGIGFTKFDNLTCTRYQGSIACPEMWDRLWESPRGYDENYADLLRVRTVVVQNELLDLRDESAPPGWRRATEDEDSGLVTVWERVDPLPYPDGRVTAAQGVEVTSDTRVGSVDERVSVRGVDSRATLTFARLNWPGYTASIDGTTLPIHTGPAGLVQVELPAGTKAGEVELSFTPPGMPTAIVAYGLGVVLTAGLGIVPWARRRRADSRAAAPRTEES